MWPSSALSKLRRYAAQLRRVRSAQGSIGAEMPSVVGGPVTRLSAMQQLLAQPRDHADMGKIGRKVLYATSDGREKQTMVYKVLRSVLRRIA